jgi:anti-repressor protein
LLISFSPLHEFNHQLWSTFSGGKVNLSRKKHMNSLKRTGTSLMQTVQTATTRRMVTVGFDPDQAARMIRVRRVLPLAEDRHTPCIDARKLWEKIGRPHGRFNDWASAYIKPMLSTANKPTFTGISVKVSPMAVGRPRTDYDLSRDVAVHLAMQANTAEGWDIRAYFLDMEELALKLASYSAVRVETIVGTDNNVTRMFIQRAGNAAKVGKITKAEIRGEALTKERRLKDTVCTVVTGHPAAYWRETFGRGVRDVLETNDLRIYSQCYETARALIDSGISHHARLLAILQKPYGGQVRVAKYLASGTAMAT